MKNNVTTSDHSSAATLKPADLLTFVQGAIVESQRGHGTEPTQEHICVCCDVANTLRSDTKRIIRRAQRRQQSGDRERNENAHFTARVVKAGTK